MWKLEEEPLTFLRLIKLISIGFPFFAAVIFVSNIIRDILGRENGELYVGPFFSIRNIHKGMISSLYEIIGLSFVAIILILLVWLFVRIKNSRSYVCISCGKECNPKHIPACSCQGICVSKNYAYWEDDENIEDS